MAHGDSKTRTSLKAIAFFEAAKGILVLSIAGGMLIFAERIQREVAQHLHYPGFTPSRELILGFAFVYATLRFSEAYGLYKDRAWGQWIGIISGGIYLPLEIKEIVEKPTLIKALITIGNILIIWYLIKTRAKEKSVEEHLDASSEKQP